MFFLSCFVEPSTLKKHLQHHLRPAVVTINVHCSWVWPIHQARNFNVFFFIVLCRTEHIEETSPTSSASCCCSNQCCCSFVVRSLLLPRRSRKRFGRLQPFRFRCLNEPRGPPWVWRAVFRVVLPRVAWGAPSLAVFCPGLYFEYPSFLVLSDLQTRMHDRPRTITAAEVLPPNNRFFYSLGALHWQINLRFFSWSFFPRRTSKMSNTRTAIQ